MKALVLVESKRFELREVPPPVAEPGGVLIAVRACGICGSDVHGMDGSTGRRRPPVVMGHEAAGEIVAVGAGVSGWAPGERVTFDSTIYCGQCEFCRAGRINLCDNRRVLGVSCAEYRQDGAFADFVAVPARILYRLPVAVSFEQGAMVEALSIAVHAVKRAGLAFGGRETALVVGAGMIGLLTIQALRAAGCGRIVAVDIEPERLKLAGELGADLVLNSNNEDVARELYIFTGNRGVEVAFEAVGVSATVQLAVSALRKGGTLVLVGNVKPTVDLPLQAVVTREISVQGSCASCGEYPACLELMASGKVDVNRLISAVAPLAEGSEWFARLYRREAGLLKVILRP